MTLPMPRHLPAIAQADDVDTVSRIGAACAPARSPGAGDPA